MGDLLTYVHYYSEEGVYLDHGKILDLEPYVGYVVKQYKTEGYEPWEIVRIEINGTVFDNRPFIKATVKIHPYIKTHCNHVWVNSISPQIITKFERVCEKCNLQQTFSYGKAKWE